MSVSVRKATHSGTWYPSAPGDLAMQIASFHNNATARYPSSKAVIVPHAGYSYSGATAAYAYNCINFSGLDTVVVIGPSHRSHINNVAVSPASEIETPLGNLTVHTTLAEKLIQDHPSYFSYISSAADQAEHSLEMQFPFIKFYTTLVDEMANDNIKVLPLIVGDMSCSDCLQIGDILADLAHGPKTAFVISSDFCHFGSRFGFTSVPSKGKALHERIKDLDMEAVKAIQTMDTAAWQEYLQRTGNTVCGREPIRVMIAALSQLGLHFDLVHYEQSNAARDATDMSVSYVAGSFHSSFD
ncbi:hypothetical protein GEMRC1_011989 [Eukaryota sp. GEM-RC1]